MSEFGQNLKNIVLKGIDLIGAKANDIATTARQKVDVFNLENEKKDLLEKIGNQVYELYGQGTDFPAPILETLQQVHDIDLQLSETRKVENEEKKEVSDTAADDPEEGTSSGTWTENPEKDVISGSDVAVYTAGDDHDVPVIEVDEDSEDEEEKCPLSSEINDLFENIPSVDKMVGKVNSSLDELGESLRKFSGDFGRQLDEFTDKMMENDKKDPDN